MSIPELSIVKTPTASTVTEVEGYHRVVTPDGLDSLSRIARMVPARSRVLDVGAAFGALGRFLGGTKSCVVDAIELDETRAAQARQHCARVVIGDLEQDATYAGFSNGSYDVVVCADVLEHLRDPAGVLRRLKTMLKPGGKLIVSLPNVGHCGVIAALIRGRFPYSDVGILDRTHLRFFTRTSAVELLNEVGLKSRRLECVQVNYSDTEFKGTEMDRFPAAVFNHLVNLPDGNTYQFVIESMRAEEHDGMHVDDAARGEAPTFAAQVFWRGTKQGFADARSLTVTGSIGVDQQRIDFLLPPSAESWEELRLDLSDRPALIRVFDIELSDAAGKPLWRASEGWNEVASAASANVLFERDHRGHLLWTAVTDDSQLILPLPRELLNAQTGPLRLSVTCGWPLSADYMIAVNHAQQARRHADEQMRLNREMREEQQQVRAKIDDVIQHSRWMLANYEQNHARLTNTIKELHRSAAEALKRTSKLERELEDVIAARQILAGERDQLRLAIEHLQASRTYRAVRLLTRGGRQLVSRIKRKLRPSQR